MENNNQIKQSKQDEELKADNHAGSSDTDAVIKRGQDAIKAEQAIAPTSKEDQQKDAEQWRNEG